MTILTLITNAFTILSNINALESGGTTSRIRLGNSWYTITELAPQALREFAPELPTVATPLPKSVVENGYAISFDRLTPSFSEPNEIAICLTAKTSVPGAEFHSLIETFNSEDDASNFENQMGSFFKRLGFKVAVPEAVYQPDNNGKRA